MSNRRTPPGRAPSSSPGTDWSDPGPGGPREEATISTGREHLRRWIALTALLALLGIAASVASARAVASYNARSEREAFALSSADVASSLRLAIQREQDLVVTGAAFFVGKPDATNAEFQAWSRSVRALERYPELLGWGQVVLVPAARLPGMIAQMAADPSGSTAAGPIVVIPPGDRPFYCFLTVSQSRTQDETTAAPPGYDYCSGAGGALELAARDSGRSGYQVLTTGSTQTLSIQVPFYRGGVTPATTEARLEAFVAWMGVGFDPNLLIAGALQEHREASLILRFRDSSSDVQFVSGRPASGAQTLTTDLQNGWTVQTFGAPIQTGVLANWGTVALLVSGILLSLALAVLLLVLVTGRASALRMVSRRTGELRHLALHDELTGLPNRALIMDRMNQLLLRGRRLKADGAVLYVDIDDFKDVNDAFGHPIGDELLVAVAARFTAVLREADTIGRMGGDEFVVLIDDAQVGAGPDLIAERLLEAMREPFELVGVATPLRLTVSIGVATGDRGSASDLLRDADVALYEAKLAGKNRFVTFEPAMQADISRRVELEVALRDAINRGELHLMYQPIYRLADLELIGTETLLRWTHPTFGSVSPEEFVPILEQNGQIKEVGRWVLGQACEQAARWDADGHQLDLSVNVSGRQLEDDTIVDDIRRALDASGCRPGSLIIEVTESALVRNPVAAARRLTAIKSLGVRIAIDDFGTGYSSLAYLQRFPVDSLKIDRCFTNGITTSAESAALIRTLVKLGQDLGFSTVAEGVETPAELDLLRLERVDQGQGFLLSHPLPPQDLQALLAARGASVQATPDPSVPADHLSTAVISTPTNERTSTP